LARRAIARGIEMLGGKIMAEADDLIDEEGGCIGCDPPCRRLVEQAAFDLGPPGLERLLEQRHHCAAALAGIARFSGDLVESPRERPAVDDRAAPVEMAKDVAHLSSAIICLSR